MAVLDATALVAAWAAATTTDAGAAVATRLIPAVCVAVPEWAGVDGTMAAWDQALLTTLAAVAPDSRLAAVTDCPACGERLDVTLASPAPPNPQAPEPAPVVQLTVPADGYDESARVTLTARVPTLDDLDRALAGADRRPDAAVGALVDRLVTDVAGANGTTIAAEARAAVLARHDVLGALDVALAEAEPAGLDPVALQCPDCGHAWTDQLELEAFVWACVERAATRLLDDVGVLAAAFGWGHDEVLALPPAVRRHYLARAGWEPA